MGVRIVGWAAGLLGCLFFGLLAIMAGARLPVSAILFLLLAAACIPATWRLPRLRNYPVWGRFVMILGFGMGTIVWAAAHYKVDGSAPGGASSAPASAIPTDTPQESSDTDSAAAAPEPPHHNWTVREGYAYGYEAALSKDDENAGVKSADILMFRYLGEKDGVYTLADADEPSEKMTCTNPCQYIKFSVLGTVVKRVEFDRDSVIGSAFEDAFNGQLEVAPRKKHREEDK